MENLLEYINQRVPLTQELQDVIVTNFKEDRVKKKTIIHQAPQYCTQLFFLEKGTIRTYYEHKDEEITSWFYPEHQFFTGWYSFYSQQPSFESIQALEDCHFYTIGYENHRALLNNYPQFSRFSRILAEEYVSFLDFYAKGYMFLSAQERYQKLLDYFPDVELRVKLGDIASFLGINQATLSRIRAKKR